MCILCWTGRSSSKEVIKLVGFGDTSGDGYSAVIYSRRRYKKGFDVRLIAARGLESTNVVLRNHFKHLLESLSTFSWVIWIIYPESSCFFYKFF